MKKFVSVGVFLALAWPGLALQVGDTYEQVIAEKGQPTGRMAAGATQILRYPDQTVKLKDGRLVSVEAVTATKPSAPPVAPMTKPTKPAVAKPAPPAEVASAWTTNVPAALELAKQTQRKVFLFFTGSDWCGWCHRLHREILSTPEFARYAADHLVLVEVDFPRRTPQPDELKAQNAKLARAFRIKGYPTVIVLDSDGKPVGELGYQEGGPGPFVEAIQKL